MKFKITFKTPDAVDMAIEEAINTETASIVEETEYYQVSEDLDIEAYNLTEKFDKYGELITVEFDTEKGTAIVVPK